MKSTNIGLVNLAVSKKLKDSYFNNTLIEESKKLTSDFLSVVKNSPILQLEFKVFNNIENKHIENDLAATRYLDSNIKLFEVYTIKEIEKEREKLSTFINEEFDANDSKVKLYNAINNLIVESLSPYNEIDVDDIHESFTYVLNHIKTPKVKEVDADNNLNLINENVIEIAINKFNEKYDSLNEDDKDLLKKLIKYNEAEKQELLESYKKENLAILESIKKDGIEEKIGKTIAKINEIAFKPDTVNDDIIGLHELKKGLI